MSLSIQNRILYRIRAKGRGWVFSARHFLDFGSREAVDLALFRLDRKDHIRRLGHGIYDYPKISPILGILSPSIDAVAKEVAEKNNSKLKITGAQATNALGLSTQVPAKVVYLTDGPSRQIKIGNQTIHLKHASPKVMSTAEKESGTVIQALRHLGKDAIDQAIVNKIRDAISQTEIKELIRAIESVPEWMKPIIHEIALDE